MMVVVLIKVGNSAKDYCNRCVFRRWAKPDLGTPLDHHVQGSGGSDESIVRTRLGGGPLPSLVGKCMIKRGENARVSTHGTELSALSYQAYCVK